MGIEALAAGGMRDQKIQGA